MKIYHGSQASQIDQLRVKYSELVQRKVSYGTPNWLMALILGTGWRDNNINLGSTLDGKPYLREITPNAFQRFLTRPTYIYTLDDVGWHQPTALCRFEYVTEHAKEPTQRQLILNPWELIVKSHVRLFGRHQW